MKMITTNKYKLYSVIATVIVFMVLGCGPRVMIPPMIDLKLYEVVGIIEFESGSEGELASYTTKKFMEAIRRDQGVIRIVELGKMDEVLSSIGSDILNQATFQALGEKYDVSTIITGELTISDVRPDITIVPGFSYISFAAEVDATLSAKMVEITTGASIWSSTARDTRRVGSVSIFGGEHFSFNADNPDEAYGKLVDALVEDVSEDFRITWRRM
jgi:hypothetical protein